MGGVWAKNVSGQRVQGVGRALHVVGRLLQGVRRRRGALEDVARLEEAVGVWPGGRYGGGEDRPEGRSHGNVGIVSRKLQTFRSKERARRDFVVKNEGSGPSGQRMGGLGKECILWSKSQYLWAKKNTSCS